MRNYLSKNSPVAFEHTAADIYIVDDPKWSLTFLGETAELEYVCMTPLPEIYLSKQEFLLMVGSIHFQVNNQIYTQGDSLMGCLGGSNLNVKTH